MYNPFRRPETKKEKRDLKIGISSLILFIISLLISDNLGIIKLLSLGLFGFLSVYFITNSVMTRSKKEEGNLIQ